MNNVLVVENLCAGRKLAIKYKKRIHRFLFKKNVHFRFVSIEKLDEIDTAEFDTIFVVGGDGTVNKVLPYLINSDKTLGIIPSGTANLLASKLGIDNISQALKAIDRGSSSKIDLLKINEKLSALRCGFGYDANIICKTPQSLKNKFGYFSYFIAGIIFALRLKKKKYSLLIDGNNYETEASTLIIANSSNMFKNIISLGNSILDDGFFEIFILTTTNPVSFFFELIKIFFKLRKNNKNAKYITAKTLTIKNNFTEGHIDGEKIKFKEDLNFNIQKSMINVYSN